MVRFADQRSIDHHFKLLGKMHLDLIRNLRQIGEVAQLLTSLEQDRQRQTSVILVGITSNKILFFLAQFITSRQLFITESLAKARVCGSVKGSHLLRAIGVR